MGSPSDSSPNFDFLNGVDDSDSPQKKKMIDETKSPKPSSPAEPESLDECTFADESAAPVPEKLKEEPTVPPVIDLPPAVPEQVIDDTRGPADAEEPIKGSDTQQFALPDFEEPVDFQGSSVIFDDLGEVPAAENNVSDGSTAIIKNNPVNQPTTFVPPEESFVPTGTDRSELPQISETPVAESPVIEPPEIDPPAVTSAADVISDSFPSFDESAPKAVEPPAPPQTPDIAPVEPQESAAIDDAPKFEMPSFDEPVEAVAPVIQEMVDLPAVTDAPVPELTSPAPEPVIEEPKTVEMSAISQQQSEANTASPPATESEAPSESDADETGSAAATAVAAAAAGGMLTIGLISYASLVTLFLLWSLMSAGGGGSQDLESLPDIAPEQEGNLSYVAPHTPLPAGHTLKVGDQQRFGNLNVEVIGITEEPLEFVHYSGDVSIKKDATAPVWKLWLKFTNVSEDQEFVALDRRLLLRWVQKKGGDREYANYYIAPHNAAQDAEHYSMYRLPIASDWDLKEQHLDETLAPGASITTYIAASDELAESPTGNLVWRFQVRKGLSPSGNGVTTIVEVPFAANDVDKKT